MANVRVFDVDLSDVTGRILSPLAAAQGLSGRARGRISEKVRDELRIVLREMLVRAYLDGSAPNRTGRSRSIMLRGIRTFGGRGTQVRGHIIGPDFIRAHNEGATITPKRAKALAIPLPPAQRPDGTPKLPGPRSWSNIVKTFIFKSKKTGQAYIAYKNMGGSLVLLYMLVDKVVLKKHSGFLDRQWDISKPSIMEVLGQAMLVEFARVDLLRLARVTTGGRGRR